MQALRRIAQLVKAQCSDVTRKGKPQKLHRLSKSVEFCRFQWQKYKLLHGMKGSNPICTGNW